MVGKELRTWLRDPMRMFYLYFAFFYALLFCLLPLAVGTRVFLPWVAATFILVAAMNTNFYGSDASALWLILLTPGAERCDVRGRQVTWGLLVAPVALVLTIALTAMSGQGWAWPWTLALTPALLGGAAGLIAVISVYYPAPRTAPSVRSSTTLQAGRRYRASHSLADPDTPNSRARPGCRERWRYMAQRCPAMVGRWRGDRHGQFFRLVAWSSCLPATCSPRARTPASDAVRIEHAIREQWSERLSGWAVHRKAAGDHSLPVVVLDSPGPSGHRAAGDETQRHCGAFLVSCAVPPRAVSVADYLCHDSDRMWPARYWDPHHAKGEEGTATKHRIVTPGIGSTQERPMHLGEGEMRDVAASWRYSWRFHGAPRSYWRQ